MKMLMRAVVVTLFLGAVTGIAVAQSPREQLQQLTTQLQQTPNDNILRERIIKLAVEIKPAPAVPEEARRSFVEGVNIVKLAKDTGAQKLAIGSFNEALKIVPWWGDAYYNLAVAQELTGQLNDAERTLKWFLLTNPGEGEAREAQDRIYGLSAKRKLAIAEAGAKQEQADREMTAQAQRFEGDWFRDVPMGTGGTARETVTIRRDGGGAWRAQRLVDTGSYVAEFPYYDIQLVGTELRFKSDGTSTMQDGTRLTSTMQIITTLSADENTLRLASTPMPPTAIQESYYKNLPGMRPRSSVSEYKKQ